MQRMSTSKQPNNYYQVLWKNKIDAEFMGDMEFCISGISSTGCVCVDCNQKIKIHTNAVRILSRKRQGSSSFYHVSCFCNVHREVFKDMAVEICEALISK
jgi:hypothetical protein